MPFYRKEDAAVTADRIKGITVGSGGDTTKLQTALKGVNSEIKNIQFLLEVPS